MNPDQTRKNTNDYEIFITNINGSFDVSTRDAIHSLKYIFSL